MGDPSMPCTLQQQASAPASPGVNANPSPESPQAADPTNRWAPISPTSSNLNWIVPQDSEHPEYSIQSTLLSVPTTMRQQASAPASPGVNANPSAAEALYKHWLATRAKEKMYRQLQRETPHVKLTPTSSDLNWVVPQGSEHPEYSIQSSVLSVPTNRMQQQASPQGQAAEAMYKHWLATRAKEKMYKQLEHETTPVMMTPTSSNLNWIVPQDSGHPEYSIQSSLPSAPTNPTMRTDVPPRPPQAGARWSSRGRRYTKRWASSRRGAPTNPTMRREGET